MFRKREKMMTVRHFFCFGNIFTHFEINITSAYLKNVVSLQRESIVLLSCALDCPDGSSTRNSRKAHGRHQSSGFQNSGH